MGVRSTCLNLNIFIINEEKEMKTKKQKIILAVAVLMIVCIIAGIFVSCGGEPASQETTGKKQTNSHLKWEDPPEFETLKPVETRDYDISDIIKDNPDKTTPGASTPTRGYAASSESDRYHLRSCYYVDNILPQNLIYFSSEYSARQAGYYPCSVCNP